MIIRPALFALSAFVGLIVPAAAQGPVEVFGRPVPVELGTVTNSQHGAASSCTIIPVTDLTPKEHSDLVHLRVPGYIEAASSPQAFVHTSLHLEAGIAVTRLCARVYDTDTTHELVVLMGGFESGDGDTAPAAVTLKAISTGIAATPGYALMCADVDPTMTDEARCWTAHPQDACDS